MCCRLQQLKAEAVQAAEIGNFPVAAAQFAAAIELCPGDAALHEQHAQCLMELEEYEKAMTAAETATTITPAVCVGPPRQQCVSASCMLISFSSKSDHLHVCMPSTDHIPDQSH